jgi:hypothetical protein
VINYRSLMFFQKTSTIAPSDLQTHHRRGVVIDIEALNLRSNLPKVMADPRTRQEHNL